VALLILARTMLRPQVAFRRKGWNTMVPEDLNSQQTLVLADDGHLLKSVSALLVKSGYGRSVRRWLFAEKGRWCRTITATIILLICLLTFGAFVAMAQTLTCTFQFTGSGTLGTHAFTNAAITLTTVGNTANRQITVPGLAFYIANDSVSISISTVGTFQFMAPTQTQLSAINMNFSNDLPAGAINNGEVDIEFGIKAYTYNIDFIYPSSTPWTMLSSLGPLNSSQFLLDGWNTSPVITDGGTLNLYDLVSTAGKPTFQATITSAPTINVSPSLLNYAYQSGGNLPQAQTVAVSATSAAASGGSWLTVNPTSGTTPAILSVSVSPAGLNPGTYNGTITVTGANGAQGMPIVNVTLTVTASLPPLPTINGATNAASYATGAVSPGELVTIFGTNIGPSAAASATTDPSTGKLATTIGGVQVLFDGTAAPMINASSTQVSAVVPYEMAPVASPSVWIKYAGQASNVFQLTSATTAPGLFTQNSSGSGPGVILNQDNTVNKPGNPAAKGSIVQVYLTGEGQTSPPSVTGVITAANLSPPQVTPAPLLAVGVTINGQPASYVYAGEAPSLVAGMMQLNVQIPANAPSGGLAILVSIGGHTSQNGVTVSVQ
jgi:uncharacterized protein (TIGR03437 family)